LKPSALQLVNTQNNNTQTWPMKDAWFLVMQQDGNCVIYDTQNKPIWQTDTTYSGAPICGYGFWLNIQTDGNVIIWCPMGCLEPYRPTQVWTIQNGKV
jgi:hypothetical protein